MTHASIPAIPAIRPYPTDESIIIHEFTEWARGKGDATYKYTCNLDCAFAQFLKEQGYAVKPTVGPVDWSEVAAVEGVFERGNRMIPEIIGNATMRGCRKPGAPFNWLDDIRTYTFANVVLHMENPETPDF